MKDEWIKETTVSDLHIAKAVSNEQLERDNVEKDKISKREDGIFELILHCIALARRKYKHFAMVLSKTHRK